MPGFDITLDIAMEAILVSIGGCDSIGLALELNGYFFGAKMVVNRIQNIKYASIA